MRALAEASVNAAFAAHGDDVAFTPSVGSAVTVKAIRVMAENIIGLPFGARAKTEGALFDVRISDFDAEPAAGDQINSAESDTFTVRSVSVPEKDVYALTRRLDCVPE